MWSELVDWLLSWWDAIKLFLKNCLLTILDLFKELFMWLFDSLLSLATTALDGLGSYLDFNPAEYISALPPEVTNYMGLIGVNTAVSIIISAVILRMILQLIPFTRLGS